MTPLAFNVNQYGIVILSVISVVYASVIALKQDELKRLLAWSSMAHVSLMAAGIFVGNISGLEGAVQQMFNHGIITLGLFYSAALIINKTGETKISALGGLRGQLPAFAGFFIWIIMASIGLPLTSGFPGEFSLLNGLFQFAPWLAVVAGLGTILGAVYMLRAYHQMMHGETKYFVHDIHQNNKALLAVGAFMILIFGIGPTLLTTLFDATLLDHISYFTNPQ